MNSDPSDRAEALAAAGNVAEAVRVLSVAATQGDPHAAFSLGVWLLAGQYLTRNLAQSRDAFRHAAAGGHLRAGEIYTAFVASGVGAKPDWPEAMRLLRHRAKQEAEAARQLSLIEAMVLIEDGRPTSVPNAHRVSARMDINVFPALLSPAECDYLIDMSGPLLEPSTVVDPRTGRLIRDPIRTSDVAGFPVAFENPVIRAVNLRLATASRTDVRQGEPLQVLRYRVGQEFKPHLDALPATDNQRVQTALVSLNADYTGGETLFLDLEVRWKGEVGDALIFANTLESGAPDPRTRHAGLPISTGEKLLASRWIRAKPIDLGG